MSEESYEQVGVNSVLASEVNRVFEARGWSSYEQAALYTNMSSATLRRMRLGMKVKSDSVMDFARAINENLDTWGRIAVGLPPIPLRLDMKKIDSADPLSRIGPDVDTSVLRLVPFIAGPVSASMTRIGEGENAGPSTTAADVLPNDVRAIEVRGESMEPAYRSGDILFVQETREAHDGDEVIALIGLDGITCKVYRAAELGPDYLEPSNGEGHIERPNFIVVGVVIGYYRRKVRH